MKREIVVTVAFGSGIALAAATIAGDLLWEHAAARMVGRLLDNVPHPSFGSFTAGELQGLPDPVVRYFKYALRPGLPLASRLRVTQKGEMRLGGFASAWKPFTAVQHFAIGPPGFVWDARVHIAPLLAVSVRDSYIHGISAGQVRIASMLTLPGQSGSPEMNAGALHRYLAEAVWCPTALLPRFGVVWDPVDDRRARTTLTDGTASVSLEFRFGEKGEIVSAYTPARFQAVKKTFVPTPWTCRYSDYNQSRGMNIPCYGSVEWELSEGRFCCLRMNLITARPVPSRVHSEPKDSFMIEDSH